MTRRRFVGAVVLALVACLLSGAPAAACGRYPLVAWFWLTKSPSEPLDRYLAGHIGILDPSLDRAYKYVAYRHLAGLGLDIPSQNAIAQYWQASRAALDPDDGEAINQWANARRRVPGLVNQPTVFTFRDNTRIVDGLVQKKFYLNCLTDAFTTAVKTLDDRIGALGAQSDEVRAWVAAQDAVFSNCQRGEVIPDALPDDKPALARADRAYQIAAAHFYAGHLEEAERHFREIARDHASPWYTVSAYLVARAIIRQGTLAEPFNRERLSAAADYLRELLASAALAEIHAPAQRLLDYVRTQLDPAARQRELAAQLTEPSLDTAAGQTLFEYLWLLQRYPRVQALDELGDWMTGHHAYERWYSTRSIAWLAAAIATTAGPGEGALELIDAAAQVPPDSPAYFTVTYHRARLLVSRGRSDEARDQLDHLLREHGDELSPGDRNRVLSLRAPLATNIEEFLRLTQQVPVVVGYDDGSGPCFGTRRNEEFAGRSLFIPYAATVVDRYFTPGLALEILRHDVLTPYLQRRVALTAWTRAVLTDDDAVAADLLPSVRALVPELAADLDAYQAATPGQARQFAVALMLLRFPGLQPNFGTPVGREEAIDRINAFRDNWWCAGGTRTADGPAAPPFVTDAQQAAAAAMHAKLGALGAGPIYLGGIVLDWANSHRRDPRVPEALHRVVEATRVGCANDDGETSKSAFQLLHRRYAKNDWTVKTPYWFR